MTLTGKVAIVTHKVQTTRARLRGITAEGESQIIFVDTPGIFAPRRKLDEAMVEAAWSGATDADVTVLLNLNAIHGASPGIETVTKQIVSSSLTQETRT